MQVIFISHNKKKRGCERKTEVPKMNRTLKLNWHG